MAQTLDFLAGLIPAEQKLALENLVNESAEILAVVDDNTELAALADGQSVITDKVITPTFTDLTGTPGDGIAHTYTGRAAVAATATACVVTNSLVSTTSVIMITPEDIDADAVKYKVAAGNGSFTVTTAIDADATWKFAWFVVK